VLIAEDEPNIIESLKFIFSREGWDVTAVMDGRAAMQRLQADPPDVIILDVMLPLLNGFEILKQVRANPKLYKLPVIMLTAKGQTQDRQTALEIGANLFVTKPFSNKEVVENVRRLTQG
jgi:DNA-binding response OmpR family regulator|tara:strand:- start:6474 stop:6830 length:357 start_codon:yes stop_codon:yes gene_type:complete